MFALDFHPLAIGYAAISITVSYVRYHGQKLVHAKICTKDISKLLIVAGYRLLLHPLSRYPGPFIAKLTDAYPGFYNFKRCLHLTTQMNHKKYGKLIAISTDQYARVLKILLKLVVNRPRYASWSQQTHFQFGCGLAR